MQRSVCGQIRRAPRTRENPTISISGPLYWLLTDVARFFT
jgi:hypothetical protein